MKRITTGMVLGMGLLLSGTLQAATVLPTVAGFDDLWLAPDSHWDGVTGAVGTANPSTILSGPARFSNQKTDWGGGFSSWSGWSYSSHTDTTTPGFGNQYSAITGAGFHSDNYGVAFIDSFGGDHAGIGFSGGASVLGAYFTNTTYAALSMANGDSFAKKFGGASGNDADWFKLTITGLDGGSATGSIDYYLADYRFSDNSQDYIVDTWNWVDLSALGVVTGLEFALSSSDNGAFGMNTPAYFALDSLVVAPVPVPPSIWLLATALLVLARRRRRT